MARFGCHAVDGILIAVVSACFHPEIAPLCHMRVIERRSGG